MNTKFASEKCPLCDSGLWEPKSNETYVFRYGRKTYEVTGLHYALCNVCGTRGYLPGQRKLNRELVKKYQDAVPGYISPSDVLSIREKYLLTQKQANEIFGGGSQGFSKWERGLTSPAGPTARLIKAALKFPEVLFDLAKEAGVELSVSPADFPGSASVKAQVSDASEKIAGQMVIAAGGLTFIFTPKKPKGKPIPFLAVDSGSDTYIDPSLEARYASYGHC